MANVANIISKNNTKKNNNEQHNEFPRGNSINKAT